MATLRRLVLVRHGETEGNSSVRFHGSGDVPLSDHGRAQMRELARRLHGEVFDLVVASPLRRAWEGARIVSGGAPVCLEHDFREIHFGRWEGMTADEIEAVDPILYHEWQAGVAGFEYPGGELRADFRKRVLRGLARLEQSGVATALVVIHKGVIRTLAAHLLGAALADGDPGLGGAVGLFRTADGAWSVGRRGSDPAVLQGFESPA
jgi:broad specificity phosphatase PhoE